MSQHNGRPYVGATFQPGGVDDYYMPEPAVASPAPQRHMHELPDQIQDGLQRLELDAKSPQPRRPQTNASQYPARYGSPNGQQSSPRLGQPAAYPSMEKQHSSPPAMTVNPNIPKPNGFVLSLDAATEEEPNFSPFPKLDPRPPNVPQSDEEHLQTLEKARAAVLSSTDPEQQLAWSQDVLRLMEIVAEQEERVKYFEGSRGSTPVIEERLRSDAMNIVMFLADQHHPRADFIKGMWLEFGKLGQREDKVEAFRSYKRAATKGYARAEYRMGMQFESTNEPVKALQHYQRGEALEDSASCYRMGMMSLLGQLGQPQDFNRAIRLIRKAAESADENSPQGAYVFGMLQARELPQIKVPEIFLPLDLESARRYVEKAAFLGFSKAQLKMGSSHELCLLGCDFNPGLSLHYNALAAARGEAEAEMALSKWFLCGYEGLFHKSEELAFKYAKRAAESALSMAEFAMGYYNEIGVYVPVNVSKALEWYQKAANNGNKDAQDRIASISSSNTLSKTDHEAIAVSRIKSQYGSRSGGRPERFQNPQTQRLPNIPDEDLNNPHPFSQESALFSSPAPPSQYRVQSVAPYPSSDRPPSVAPYPVNDRPASTTPYPVDETPRPSSRLPPAGRLYGGDQRPQSAAPDPRGNSLYGNPPPRGSIAGPSTVGRPYATDPMNDGRSYSTPPAQRPPPGAMGSQGYGPNRPPPQGRMSTNSSSPPMQPRPNMGPGNGYDPRMQRRQDSASRPGSLPPSNQGSNPLNASPRPSQTPSKLSSTPANPAGAAKPTQPSQPAQALKPKGPQTFEEMGVPSAKKDNDCVLM